MAVVQAQDRRTGVNGDRDGELVNFTVKLEFDCSARQCGLSFLNTTLAFSWKV